MNKYIKLVIVACMASALISSCGKNDNKITKEPSEEGKNFIGNWKAESSQRVGFSLGYGAEVNISPDGSCEMKVRYDTSNAPEPGKLSKVIHLNGNWTVVDGKLALQLKLASWVVTDWGNYRQEQEFDDFVTPIKLVFEGENLRSDTYMINLGTTEEARKGLSLYAKGEGIILTNVTFFQQ